MRELIQSKGLASLFVVLLLITGCATTQERLLDSDQSQVKLRSIQSRAFDTTDKEKTLRARHHAHCTGIRSLPKFSSLSPNPLTLLDLC